MRKMTLQRVVTSAPDGPSFGKVGDKAACPFGCRGTIKVVAITGVDDDGLAKGTIDHLEPSCRFWSRYIKLTREQKAEVWKLPTLEARRERVVHGR